MMVWMLRMGKVTVVMMTVMNNEDGADGNHGDGNDGGEEGGGDRDADSDDSDGDEPRGPTRHRHPTREPKSRERTSTEGAGPQDLPRWLCHSGRDLGQIT